jgi:hypothetical protein
MSRRLDGIDQIVEYMGISKAVFYREHYQNMKPFLLTRDLSSRRKIRTLVYTFTDLIQAYLIKLEIERSKKRKRKKKKKEGNK